MLESISRTHQIYHNCVISPKHHTRPKLVRKPKDRDDCIKSLICFPPSRTHNEDYEANRAPPDGNSAVCPKNQYSIIFCLGAKISHCDDIRTTQLRSHVIPLFRAGLKTTNHATILKRTLTSLALGMHHSPSAFEIPFFVGHAFFRLS